MWSSCACDPAFSVAGTDWPGKPGNAYNASTRAQWVEALEIEAPQVWAGTPSKEKHPVLIKVPMVEVNFVTVSVQGEAG